MTKKRAQLDEEAMWVPDQLEYSTKVCKDCGEEKHTTEFSYHPETKDNLRGNCKVCRSIKSEATRDKSRKKDYNRDYYTSQSRRNQIMKKYGITLEQYEELLEKQDHKCAICDKHKDEFKINLAVDHNHITGEIRGLLCAYCNHRVIGRHRDGNLLRKMADYVDQGTGWFVPKKKRPVKRKPKR